MGWSPMARSVVLKLALPGRYDRLAVGLYLALGWSGVMLYDPVVKALPGLAKYQVTQGETVANGYYYNAYEPNLSPAQTLQPFFAHPQSILSVQVLHRGRQHIPRA